MNQVIADQQQITIDEIDGRIAFDWCIDESTIQEGIIKEHNNRREYVYQWE